MSTIELKAHVGKGGIVTLQLPADFEDDDVVIMVSRAKPAPAADDVPWEERPWTKEEIAELMKSNPKTLGEIAQSPEFGAWADLGIEDSQAWVENVRREEQERRRWPRD